jgi:hypothetical protein
MSRWSITLASLALAVTAQAEWTYFPLASNEAVKPTAAVIRELLDAVNEKCRPLYSPAHGSSGNFPEDGGTNFYAVTPISYTWSARVSTGLYVAGTTSNVVVSGGETNVFVYTNWVMGYRFITCTNLDCSDNGVVVSNVPYPTRALLGQIDGKIMQLLPYYLDQRAASNALAWLNANTNATALPAWGSATNIHAQTGAMCPDLYMLDGIAANATSRTMKFLVQPRRSFAPVLLGEFLFRSTGAVEVVDENSNTVHRRQVTVRYEPRNQVPIYNLSASVWSNENSPVVYRWINPNMNGPADVPAASFTISGSARYWDAASNRPRVTNVTAVLSPSGAAGPVGPWNLYAVSSGESSYTVEETDEEDGPKIEGAALQLLWTNVYDIYGDWTAVIAPEALNDRWKLVRALEYTRDPATFDRASSVVRATGQQLFNDGSGFETNYTLAIQGTERSDTYVTPPGGDWAARSLILWTMCDPENVGGVSFAASYRMQSSSWRLENVSAKVPTRTAVAFTKLRYASYSGTSQVWQALGEASFSGTNSASELGPVFGSMSRPAWPPEPEIPCVDCNNPATNRACSRVNAVLGEGSYQRERETFYVRWGFEYGM